LLLMLGGFGQGFLMYFYPEEGARSARKITLTESLDFYKSAGMDPRVRAGKFFLSYLTQADGAEGFLASTG
jgi:hypothetical protein